jgi:hypothetical protein
MQQHVAVECSTLAPPTRSTAIFRCVCFFFEWKNKQAGSSTIEEQLSFIVVIYYGGIDGGENVGAE